MKLIVGLGNPGRIYQDSRHNIGFGVIKSLSQIYRINLKRDSAAFSLSNKVKIGQQAVLLAIPLTFMNLSGIAVRALVKKYKIDLNGLLIVCDDLDLEFGRLKIRPRGSCGGHRGLESIIDSLGRQDFARLRIGIGRPRQNSVAANYVLSNFTKKEKKESEEIIKRTIQCCQVWAAEGIQSSMNIFNRKESKDEKVRSDVNCQAGFIRRRKEELA